MHDPALTPLGESQCAALAKAFPYHSEVTHLMASPLRRTLYTCLLSFPTEVAAGLPILAVPEVQELSDLPCDTGSEPADLAREFTNGTVDLTLVHPGWNSKTGKWSPRSSALEARAKEARVFLRDFAQEWSRSNGGKDVQIVVVTHGGFLHYFTEDWEGTGKYSGTGWANCEYRSFEFQSMGDARASVRELPESRERRRGSERDLSADEHRELRAAAEREWVLAGFQKLPPADEMAEIAKL